jgi:SNF2 family DNA or RNA helicase
VDVGERYARVPAQPIAATLVVAPQTLITQWQGELRQHAPSLRVLTYRGMDGAVWARTFAGVDVVLTSYEQLRREMPRGTRTEKWSSPLLHCEWWRIVLDEAQTVSSGKSNTAVMSALLERQHSWCVSGTPLANSIADLRGLLNFLWFHPGHLSTGRVCFLFCASSVFLYYFFYVAKCNINKKLILNNVPFKTKQLRRKRCPTTVPRLHDVPYLM